ncbi:unnamed protein product [Knipowitschia caucasica]
MKCTGTRFMRSLWVVNMVLNQQFLFPSCVEHLLLPPLGCPNLEHLDKVAPTCFLLRISKVHIGEVMSGKITSSRTVVIRFTESEATVDHITAKVKEALGCEDSLTLTDSQGNEIIDSHATRILITGNKTQGKYMLFTMRSSSSGEVGGRTKQDDLKHAAESLPDITEAIRVLSDIAKRGAQEATLTLARDSQLSCV